MNLMNCLKRATRLKVLMVQIFLRTIDRIVHINQQHNCTRRRKSQDPHLLQKGEPSDMRLIRRLRHCQAKSKRGQLSLAEASHFQDQQLLILIRTSPALRHRREEARPTTAETGMAPQAEPKPPDLELAEHLPYDKLVELILLEE